MQLDGAREKTLYAKWQYFHRSLFNHDRLLGGVDLMCKAMEELREQSIQRGIDQSRIESIKNIMEGLKYTAQQAMDLLKIPVSDQPKYLSKL